VADRKVVVVGAGVGGLVAAVQLAARGVRVTVLERAEAPGGKMRQVRVGPAAIDAGPTVFTMRWVFDEIFRVAGERLEDRVTLRAARVLARHAWGDGSRLDLFADFEQSVEAIARFAGAGEARGFRDFSARALAIYRALEGPYLRSDCSGPLALVRKAGLSGLGGMARISPFTTLWRALSEHFRDPRLRQLFGRYATYNGSSPFLAPATLMLIAHVERDGVWLVEGGMHALARALAGLAERHGAQLRYGCEVSEVEAAGGRAGGVRLAGGERIAADAVLLNADCAALAQGLFGQAGARACAPVAPSARSLSALTWCMLARTQGFPLARHSVFFSDDYAAEFDDLFVHARLPARPTVYVCAQDRADGDEDVPADGERLMCLVNAPARGDSQPPGPEQIERCGAAAFGLMARCGLRIEHLEAEPVITGPEQFARLFPGSGGALYGRVTHGWNGAFERPGARTRLPGLYLAGGSVHPGAGVPTAALSGCLASAALLSDLGERNVH